MTILQASIQMTTKNNQDNYID